MNVAHAPAALGVDAPPVFLDPGAVVQRKLAAQRPHHHRVRLRLCACAFASPSPPAGVPPCALRLRVRDGAAVGAAPQWARPQRRSTSRLLGRSEGEQHLLVGLVHQQLAGAHVGIERLAVDRHQHVAHRHVDPRQRQRRSQRAIPGVAMHDLRHAVAACRLVPAEACAQVAHRVVGSEPEVAAQFVGVAGAQFALHLAQQVRELQAAAHALDQREVAQIDAVPVHLLHVLAPEVVALQAPRLAEHLLPLAERVHRNFDATGGRPSHCGAAGRCRRGPSRPRRSPAAAAPSYRPASCGCATDQTSSRSRQARRS